MGVIRGGLLVIVSVLLFVSLFAGFLLLTMSWSLNYENVKVNLKEAIGGTVGEAVNIRNALVDNYPEMVLYCETYSDYVVSFEGQTITIPCSVIMVGEDQVFDSGVDYLVETIYFTQYDCSFWDCFSEDEVPFFLVSAKAQQYWYTNFNYVLLVIGILAILGFLLSEKKSNFFLLVSVLVILAALPFAKFNWFIGMFGDEAQGLLSVFFSKAYTVFISGLILGGILLVIGVILKFFKVGFKIQSIFAKGEEASKEVVKEEKKPDKKVVKKIVKKKKK